jgi:MFS family permease
MEAWRRDSLASSRDSYLVSPGHAWFAFGLTFLLMLSDFIDRQIIVSMFPYLKADWGLSDKQLGALVSVVSVTVGLGAVPVAFMVDRWSRVKSIALMAGIWSLATIACAFSKNYAQLFAARSVVGVGEAGYGAAGAALLATHFPSRMRGTIIGAFLAAATLGSVLGVVLGGVISARWSWQAAFGIVGVPGLLFALLYLMVRDYPTVPLVERSASSGVAARMSAVHTLAELFRARSGVAAYVGGALQLFVVSTLIAWLPSYFNRYYGLPGDQAGIKTAGVILAASVGAALWGYLADRLARARPRNRLLVPAGCSLATLVLLSLAFGVLPAGNAQFLAILAAGAVMTGTVGPVGAVAMDVVHSGLRATAAAMVALVQNLFGLAAGPFIAGALSDSYGLRAALGIVPVCSLLAAAVFVLGSRAYEADLRRVADSPEIPRTGAAPMPTAV